MKKAQFSAGGSIASAILASICCIGPVVVGLAGLGSLGAFFVFEEYRTVFIVVAVVFIALAFYLAYRRQEIMCEDGTCKVESASRGTKLSVWGATAVTALAIAFPYFGLTSSVALSSSLSAKPVNLNEDISFFRVPLVCNAAPHIGCGSRAKFIMLDLMKEQPVKEAWLNRKGTVMAVVWNETASSSVRESALKSIFSRHDVPVEQATGEDRTTLAANFKANGEWFKGSEVDALSIEEAGVIADQILAKVSAETRFKNDEEKWAFRNDVKAIFERLFLSLTSYGELNHTTYHRIEKEIVQAGEKYLGKGNMPHPGLCSDNCDSTEDGAECCAKEKKSTPATEDCCNIDQRTKKQ